MKSTIDSSDSEEKVEEASVAALSPPSKLSIFREVILLSILSYVADVPFEIEGGGRAPVDSHSTITHTLPLVCKQFHKLIHNHDLYWKHALLRLVEKEPTLWKEGLNRMVFDAKCDELRTEIMDRKSNRAKRGKRTKEGQTNEHQHQQPPQSVFESKISASCKSENPDTSSDDKKPLTDEEALLQQACTAIQSHPPHHHTATSSGIYQCLYQNIVNHHLRYQAPVFYMPQHLRLGSPYGLHFFEPRYRVLISEVMAPYPVSARRGEVIMPRVPGLLPPPRDLGQVGNDDIKSAMLDLFEKNESTLTKHHFPTFIHAHQSPLRRNTPATIVQVVQCAIQPDGSADVFMKPLAYIWLEEIWERPGTGGLVEARGMRMGGKAGESNERRYGMSVFGRGDGRGI